MNCLFKYLSLLLLVGCTQSLVAQDLVLKSQADVDAFDP